jgi:phage shock protein E
MQPAAQRPGGGTVERIRSRFDVAMLGLVAVVMMAAGCTAASPAAHSSTPASQPSAVQVEGGSYTDVEPRALSEMLKAKDFTLVNVHIPDEGSLAATDLAIPYDEITRRLDQLPADKGARIVLYCRSGRMSDIAARALVKAGYRNIWNLKGGMIAWQAAGYPLADRK